MRERWPEKCRGSRRRGISATSSRTTTFAYNALGQRVAKTVNGSSTYNYYDGFGTLAAIRNSSGWTEEFFPTVGGRNYAKYQNGNTYFLHGDMLASSTMATNQAGSFQQDMLYYPWGGVWSQYSSVDTRFAGMLERDGESQLDPTPNRLFYNYLGRWVTPDIGVDQHPEDPQSWNLYAYARNNPLDLVDPTGEYICGSSMTQAQCEDFQKGLDKAQVAANAAKDKYGADSEQYKEAQRAIDAYGKAGVNNGVTIQVGDTGKYGGSTTFEGVAAKTADNPTGQRIEVKLSSGLVGDATSEAHEGSHVADGSAWAASAFSSALDPTRFETEMRAYRVSDTIGEGLGNTVLFMSFGDHPTRTYLLDHFAWPAAIKDVFIKNILLHEYPNLQLKAFRRNTRGGH